jgi:hypothetical protein
MNTQPQSRPNFLFHFGRALTSLKERTPQAVPGSAQTPPST